MPDEPKREWIASFFSKLRGTFLEGELILGGSSGLFGFATEAPAFTEDLDFLIREDLVVDRGQEIIRLLATLGFRHESESAIFTSPEGLVFDLVGYSTADPSDHLSPPGPLQVMVFGDLGKIFRSPECLKRDPEGILALSPAGFCAVKLLALRVEKGAKDKLQALLVIAERAGDRTFREALVRILSSFDVDRRVDALADAQAAFLSLQRDPEFRDHGAEGYARFLEQAEEGYRVLAEMLREPGNA